MEISPGKNIAIKVPLHKWEETVAYYRDKVGLTVTKTLTNSVGFSFGSMTLWIDRVERQAKLMCGSSFSRTPPSKRLENWRAQGGTNWNRWMMLTAFGPLTLLAWFCWSGTNDRLGLSDCRCI